MDNGEVKIEGVGWNESVLEEMKGHIKKEIK